MVDSCIPSRETSYQASSSLETGALRYCPLRMGSKSGWALYHQRHKIWECQYNKDTMKVFHLKGMVMDLYEPPSLVRNNTNRPNCWTWSRIDVLQVDQGVICSMKDVALHSRALFSIHLNHQS
jgi:hypothetical protein